MPPPCIFVSRGNKGLTRESLYEGETKELRSSGEWPLRVRRERVALPASGQASGEKGAEEKSIGEKPGAWWRCAEEEGRGMEKLGGGICRDGLDGIGFGMADGFGGEFIGGRCEVLLVLVGGIGVFGMALGIFESE